MTTIDSLSKLYKLLSPCYLCPLNCKVERLGNVLGRCDASIKAKISSYTLYKGEEPPLAGNRGSGAIFFSHCNLKCVYCQNYNFSQFGNGREVSVNELSSIMLKLEQLGALNINLVTATHYLPQAMAAVNLARGKGLRLPTILNTSGYESKKVLSLLKDFIDIYLVDFRYSSDELGEKYSGIKFYKRFAVSSIKEMLRQKPEVQFDKTGIVRRGVIIRLLVFPNGLEELKKILAIIKWEFGLGVCISLMSQFTPVYRAKDFPEISRKLTREEITDAIKIVREEGFRNGWIQFD